MEITEVVPGIYRVPIPIPAPLREVNCYAARGKWGWTLVDTGFYTPAAEEAWRRAFGQLGIRPGDIEAIIVTHFHPDHYGAAGWLQQLSGAPVYMHDREVAVARRVWREATIKDLEAFAGLQAVPGHLLPALVERRQQVLSWVQPQPEVTAVSEGASLAVGDRPFRVLWTPGHTDGLMVLWNEAEGILLANDLILSDISPNISAGPLAAPDPLGRYLASLAKVRELPAVRVLPGHRRPLADLRQRCDELRAHHERRLQDVLDIVRRRGEATGWEVAVDLFGPVMNSSANVEFALGETVAHLEYLARRGALTVTGEEGAVRYRLPR
ncbi:MAG TPA: MBL fold metallo-hydrolase [Thermaerobacter sp.]